MRSIAIPAHQVLRKSGPSREPCCSLLQRVVRGAAQVASTETGWISAVLAANVDIEPRWASGGRDTVVG